MDLDYFMIGLRKGYGVTVVTVVGAAAPRGGTLANFFGVLGRRGNPMNDTERKKSTIKKIKIIHSIRASS